MWSYLFMNYVSPMDILTMKSNTENRFFYNLEN